MIARITEHTQLPDDLDPAYVERHRAWLASQPGFCGGYHLLEPETGHAISLILWESREAIAAVAEARRRGESPADGRISHESQPRTRVVDVEAIF
jgi:heme-degrading monooxygenase HmoA